MSALACRMLHSYVIAILCIYYELNNLVICIATIVMSHFFIIYMKKVSSIVTIVYKIWPTFVYITLVTQFSTIDIFSHEL